MSDLFDDKNVSPMLLYESRPFDDDNYIFELKLDGIRCIAYIDKKSVTLQNKRFKDVTQTYPELSEMRKCVKKRVVLDGELVALGEDGKPDFYALQKRSLTGDRFRISLAAKKNPVHFVAYDILYLDGEDLTGRPLTERKDALAAAVTEGHYLSVSRYIERDGVAFFRLAKEQRLEGIVAKKKDGLYHIGKRTRDWLKIKVMKDEDLLVLGYLPDENGKVKNLILGAIDGDGTLRCRGKVGIGISEEERKLIAEYAETNGVNEPWFAKYKNAVWIKPGPIGTVQYMQETASGGMRQPVWKGLRDDIV